MVIPEFPPPYHIQHEYTPNMLVVGETGVGKSSVINLIAGEQLADVSSGASGCTMEATPYDIVLRNGNAHGGHHVRLFDTVGLNEPSLDKEDYLAAIEKANVLITRLQRTGGIRLLLFCVRGRITTVTQSNYYLFRHILCQNQVPVAFVVTGMEDQRPMEDWWHRNAAQFEKSNLFCTSHVCVTATRGLNDVYAHQHQLSQTAIHSMLLEHISRTSWKPEPTGWFIHLASKLLKWVVKIKDRKRHLPRRPKSLTVEELARHLEDKCKFSREGAVELAGKIWAKRTEGTGHDTVKGGDAGDLFD